MDLSLLMEVMVEKGYLHVMVACIVALVLLLVLRKVIPAAKGITTDFKVNAERVLMGQEFEVSICCTARKKVKIEELHFFMECLTLSPLGGKAAVRRCYYFEKEVALKDVSLYPRCSMDETRKLKVPEKGIPECEGVREKNAVSLPGTFTSQNGHYSIIWEVGFRLKLADSYEKIEERTKLIVHPLVAGW